jgi:hypothetical protein
LDPVFSKQDLKILTAVTEQSTYRKVKHVLSDGSLKTVQASRSNSKTKVSNQKDHSAHYGFLPTHDPLITLSFVTT